MLSGPRNLVRCLLNDYPVNTHPKRLVEVVASTILEKRWADHENFAAERAESWSTSVKEQLRNKLNEASRDRSTCPYRIQFLLTQTTFRALVLSSLMTHLVSKNRSVAEVMSINI